MGWIITLGILFLLAILPLGVGVSYDEEGMIVQVLAGVFRIQLFPGKKKGKLEKKEAAKEEKKPQKAEALPTPPQKPKAEPAPQEEKKGGSLLDFLPLVKVGVNLLNDFRRKLRVDRLEVKLVLAGDDPCDLAASYGRIWAAMGNLMPRLERWLVIKKRDINVECDFTGEETLVTARLELTITLGRLLALGAVYGVRALKEFLLIMKKRNRINEKAVPENE